MNECPLAMSSPSQYLVSVIIPSHKMGQFIGEALESVGAQTYPRWEVIVVDDAGPEDGTRAVVEAFAAKYPDHRVEYIRHETNQGVSVARRTAFEASRGDYIAFLDSDDEFLPEKLANQTRILDENRDIILTHSPVEENKSDGSGERCASNLRIGSEALIYNLWERDGVLEGHNICNSSVMCRREVISKEDFPENMFFQYEDWLMWMLVSERGNIHYYPVALSRYRIHDAAYSSRTFLKKAQHDLALMEMLLALYPRLKSRMNRARVLIKFSEKSLGVSLDRCVNLKLTKRFRVTYCLSLAYSAIRLPIRLFCNDRFYADLLRKLTSVGAWWRKNG